ncbi:MULTISPECIES: hypothetical protein [unclassified Rhodanobacter]|uniref:hypothetical protein n=1 Tax=unclassified Rhodanobacter TaxID=2621553 RepID=UPI0007A9B41A|nr:hypothetical protein [Rhodanobacter sp. FW510-R10]KZC32589.1 hypothetical protein RhoFW510R10_11785 [Rhodanobacter sp. FW510-R10]
MTFLNTLKPVLRGQSAVTFRLTATEEGGFRLLVTPSLQGIDADTDDVELAHLQALLAAPFTLALPAGADLDQALADAVAQFQSLREPKLNELDALRARMAAADADAKKRADEAKEAAKDAAKAKAAKGKTAPAKVAPKPQPAPPPTGDMFGLPADAPPPAADSTAAAATLVESEGTDDADTEEEAA